MTESTEQSAGDAAHAAETADEQVTAHADRMPTPEEEAAAERAPALDPAVAEAYRDAAERGAHVEGEGQIT